MYNKVIEILNKAVVKNIKVYDMKNSYISQEENRIIFNILKITNKSRKRNCIYRCLCSSTYCTRFRYGFWING